MNARYLSGLTVLLLVAGCGKNGSGNDMLQRWDPGLWSPVQIQKLENGRRLYVQNCAACHLVSGQGQATLGAPALQRSAVATGPAELHIGIVLNGRGNAAMPAFSSALDTRTIADIISYERNAWGNRDPALIDARQVEMLKTR